MAERRYSDEEVAAILRAAAESPESRSPVDGPEGGLTLRELQMIAGEVDISPDAVARAARSLESSPATTARSTFLGLPIAVQRTVALDRRLTDAEWELLVVELRETFRARGTVRAQGSFREWSNGNLQALLEPTPTGHRLRLGTVKGNARASMTAGALTLALTAAMAAGSALNGTLAAAVPGIAMLATVGTAVVAAGALQLPSWARRRRRQMDAIAERVVRQVTQGQPG